MDTTLNLVYQGFQFSQKQIATDTAFNPFKTGGRFIIEAKTLAAGGDTIRRSIIIRTK